MKKPAFSFFTSNNMPLIIMLFVLFLPQLAMAEGYAFQRMWPTTPNDWSLEAPTAVAVDKLGNIYVVDGENDRINKFNETGILVTSWGGSGSSEGKFNYPYGIALDAEGNVYVADTYNDRIQKFTENGTFLGQWGKFGSNYGEFRNPTAIAVDADDNVYVADTKNNRIQKFSNDGIFVAKWGSTGSGDGQFYNPQGIGVDKSGNIYVSDTNNHRIQKFTNTGVFVAKWGGFGSGEGKFQKPIGISLDAAGNLYVADSENHRVQKLAANGTFVDAWGNHGAGNVEFITPAGIAVDMDGNIYVTDPDARCVQKRTKTGIIATKWGNFGNGDGEFYAPRGIAVDAVGYIYVSDTGNHRIQKFAADGTFVATLGHYGDGDGEFMRPSGIAVDANGNIYVADTENHRIQKFNAAGVFVTKWGKLGIGDGEFCFPRGIAVDLNGNVYVADTENHRVQKFSTTGSFTTKWGTFGENQGMFKSPQGIAVDASGNVYVVSPSFVHLQKFTNAGIFVAVWSDYGDAVAADKKGDIYVSTGNRIKKSAQTGAPITTWGSRGLDKEEFIYPEGIAVDDTGNVYVADTGNHRIQKFTPGFNITVNATWNGRGLITSNSNSINFTYPQKSAVMAIAKGGTVSLSATADLGSTVSWAGCDSTSGTSTKAECTISQLTTDRTVKATFAQTIFFRDADGDGYGDPNNTGTGQAGQPPAGYVTTGGDCNDSVKTINPWGKELCDNIDNNCNGQVDENNPGGGEACDLNLPGVCKTGAGIRTCINGVLVCRQINYGGDEICDGLDNNCDGQIDEGNPGGGLACNTGLLGVCNAGTKTCSAGTIECIQNTSASEEVPDGLDNDCDGQVDEKGYTVTNEGKNVIKSITAGKSHTAILKKDGSVLVWGGNEFGQSNVPANLSAVIAISSGEQFVAALTSDGSVVVWGDNRQGQANVPSWLMGVKAISAGANHVTALKTDGTVVAWGANNSGQTNVPAGLTGVTAISAGANHNLALKNDGTVITWGDNSDGQLNVPAGLGGVKAIKAGESVSYAIKNDGSVVAWGDNNYGQLAVPSGLTGVVAIADSSYYAMALKNDGTVVVWGYFVVCSIDICTGGCEYSYPQIPPDLGSGIIAIAAGSNHFMVLKENGTLSGWDPFDGERYNLLPFEFTGAKAIAAGTKNTMVLKNDGTMVSWGGKYPTPSGLDGLKSIASGGDNAAAIKNDGTVVVWGNNQYMKEVPAGLTGVTAIAVGGEHVLALKNDGTVAGWGQEYRGQLKPVGIKDVKAIAAGSYHSVVLKTDGTLIALGDDSSGQTKVPTGLSGVVAISARGEHNLALKNDGTVVEWGKQLSSVPAGLSGVTSIAAGESHSLALKNDGTVVAWGDNQYGQAKVPAGLTGVISIAAGDKHSVALKSDGSVIAWGNDEYGQCTTLTDDSTTPFTHGTVSCQTPVAAGGSALCTITPATGYYLSAFAINGIDRLAQVKANRYTINNIQANQVVTAAFSLIKTFYRDADGDGFGDPNNLIQGQPGMPPAGYVFNNTDCNDANAQVSPGIAELCEPYGTSQVDNNCNGQTSDSSIYATYWFDNDGDGFGDSGNPTNPPIVACGGMPAGYVPASKGQDVDDKNPACFPESRSWGCVKKPIHLSAIYDYGTWRNWYSIVNTWSAKTEADLVFRDTNGILTTTKHVPLGPSGQYYGSARLDAGGEITGSLEIAAAAPMIGVNISQSTQNGKLYSVYGSITPEKYIILPHLNEDRASSRTGVLTITNTSSLQNNVALRFYDMEGKLAINPLPTVTLAPGAQLRKRIMEVAYDGFKGSLHINANQPVTATFDQGITTDFRYASYGSITPANTIYYPHANAIDPWYSWFLITNAANAKATVDVMLYNFDGTLNKTVQLTLQPYASYGNQIWKMADIGFRGYIKAVSNQPVAGIQTFNNYTDGRYGSYGTPLPDKSIYFPYVVHKTTPSQGNWLAVVNVGNKAATVDMNCYSQTGEIVKASTADLVPNQSYGNSVKNICGAEFEGSIKITSPQPLVGYTSFNDYVTGGYGAMEHVLAQQQ